MNVRNALRGASTVLTNANGGKSSWVTSTKVWCASKMSSTFQSKDGEIVEKVAAKVDDGARLVHSHQGQCA